MTDSVCRITDIPSMVLIEDQRKGLEAMMAETGLTLRNHLKKQMSDLTLTSVGDDYYNEMVSMNMSQNLEGCLEGDLPDSAFVDTVGQYIRNSMRNLNRAPEPSPEDDENEIDMEQQLKMMEYYETKKIAKLEEEERERELNEEMNELFDEPKGTMIEVAPGLELPLRTIEETYRSIVTGKIVSATCFSCQKRLHAIEDVTMLVCGDCWLCIPPERNERQAKEFAAKDPNITGSVGLGVTDEDIANWFSKNQEY